MRYLHTMLRVRDLDAALDFFCTKLGLVELRPKHSCAISRTIEGSETGAGRQT